MSNFGISNGPALRRLFARVTVILTGLVMLAGCGSGDKKESSEKKDEEKRPAYERVAILRERFDQLELSLDEMERELEIQRARIKKTRETALAIKRSLIKGNLKGYSIDTITTDPLVIAAIDKEKQRAEKKDKDEDDKKDNGGSVLLDITLAILIILLVLFILFVALKDRKQASPYTMPVNRAPTGPEDDYEDEEEAVLPPSPGTYGELRPSSPDNTAPEEPGQNEEPKP